MNDANATKIKDWMTPVACTIKRDQTIREALDLLGKHRISALPVVDDEEKPVGILTIGDFMRAVAETDQALDSSYPHFDDCLWAVELIQRKLGTDKVYSLMSESPTTANPSQSMKVAAHVMCESNLHHLLICNEDGTLAGVLSASDFVRFVKDA